MKKTGGITRFWLTIIHVSDMDRALKFYLEKLDLPITLDAKMFSHAEVDSNEPLAKIGMHVTGKKVKRKRRTDIVFDIDDIYALY